MQVASFFFRAAKSVPGSLGQKSLVMSGRGR